MSIYVTPLQCLDLRGGGKFGRMGSHCVFVSTFFYATWLICMFVGHFGLPPGGEVLGYTDLLIERDKAANRKVIIDSLQAILETSMQQWRVAEDPRFLELAMRATDRLTKLLRLDQPEGAVSQGGEGPDVAGLVAAVRRDLVALEARMSTDG